MTARRLLTISLLACALATHAQAKPMQYQRIGAYEVRISEKPASVTFWKNKSRVYEKRFPANCSVKSIIPSEGTGDSTPNAKKFLLVLNINDGKKNTYEVLSLGQSIRRLATFPTGTMELRAYKPHAADLVRLHGTETFENWGAQRVVADFTLEISPAQMCLVSRKLKPNEFKELVEQMRSKFAHFYQEPNLGINYGPPDLAEQVFSLAYGGHLDQARRLLDAAWPPNRIGKEQYWKFLVGELHKKPVWTLIKTIRTCSP